MIIETPPYTAPPAATPPATSRGLSGRRGLIPNNIGDPIFYWGTLLFATSVLVVSILIGIRLWQASGESISKFGLGFLSSSAWNPNAEVQGGEKYGAWPYIFGTLVSSVYALILAVPVGVMTAIFLAELAPKWLRTPLSFLVELLAAVPSIVYGLWGRFVLVPRLIPLQEYLSERFGSIPLFAGAPQGNSMMAGALVLAIMILPFITAVSREVIKAVPSTQREAAFGLGATHWEAIKGPILRYARSGIIGAIILGLARALGETMAMTIVMGNASQASWSLLAGSATLSTKIANEFNEAGGLQRSSLLYLALVLFGITIVVNAIARGFIWQMARHAGGATRE